MSAPPNDDDDNDSPRASSSSSCSEDEEQSTDLLAMTPNSNNNNHPNHPAAADDDDGAAIHHNITTNICNMSHAATTTTQQANHSLSSPFTMTWRHQHHQFPQQQLKQQQQSPIATKQGTNSTMDGPNQDTLAAGVALAALRSNTTAVVAQKLMYRTYNKCYHIHPDDTNKTTRTVQAAAAAAAAAAADAPYCGKSNTHLASSLSEINNDNDKKGNKYQTHSENNPRSGTGVSSSSNRKKKMKKRPLQFILDEKIRQSKEGRSRNKRMMMMMTGAAEEDALPSSFTPTGRRMAQKKPQPGSFSDNQHNHHHHLASMKSNNDHAMVNLKETETAVEAAEAEANTKESLPISEMIIVGHGGGATRRGVHIDDEDNDVEEEEEFSPLTCPASQPAWGGYNYYNQEEEEEVKEDEEDHIIAQPEMEKEKEDEEKRGELLNNDLSGDACFSSNAMKIDKPISSNMENSTKDENIDDDDDEEETRMIEEDVRGKEIDRMKELSTLPDEYKKALFHGGRIQQQQQQVEEDDDNDDDGCKVQQRERWARNKGNAIGTRPPPSSSASSLNAVPVANTRNIIRKGRGEATVMALAAEYEESSTSEDGEDDDEVDKQQRWPKRKVGPTALALAEYDETGEIDSYFDNSKAAEERKQRLLALATCMENETESKARCAKGNEDAVAAVGELSCTSEEKKQSEPLLSPIIPAEAVTVAHEPKSSINEMICSIRHEFDEMGKALLCPICQSTLKNAIILPCVHAFCKACLKDYYNPPSVKSTGGVNSKKKKKRKDMSPPRKPKAECPVCKTANPGKRSGEAAPHLDELARAYKLMGRSFSFAPVKYSENVLMTQLEPDEDDDAVVVGRYYEDTESKVQHLQVAKAVHGAFVEQTEIHQSQHSSSRPISLKEKMKVHRYQMMAKEQEAVVRADEQVLSRVARGVRGMKQMVNAVKTVFVGKTEASSTSRTDLVAGANDASSLIQKKVALPFVADSSAAIKQHVGNERIGNKSIGIKTNEAIDDDVHDEESTSGEDEFFSSREEFRDESQSRYSTAGEDIQSPSCLSVTVINDGNTIKKAHQPELSCPPMNRSPRGSNVGTLDTSSSFLRETRVSIGTEAAARSSPLVVHDGNTVRKPRNEKSYHGLSFLATRFSDTSNSKSPENVSPLAPAAVVVKNLDAHVSKEKAHDITENISVGSIVFVQARTWPGINKPGGVARVTKVHPHSDTGNSTKFDVAYVLGGKEKGVDESFVTFNVNEMSTIEECPDDSMTTQGCKSHEKKVRQRRAIVKSQIKAPPPNAPSFSVYCDEELKHIPEDVLKWAGMLPKKKGKMQQQQQQQQQKKTGTTVKKAIKSVKRVLMQSNAVPNLPPVKKRKLVTVAKDDAKTLDRHDESHTVKSLREVISSLSIDEIVTRADSRYSTLLSPFGKQSASSQMELHAVTSSLSDADLELLVSFRQFLKGKSVVLKLMKDFNPDKTQICITAASSPSSGDTLSEPIDVVSSSRTLKVMRSTLIGIPILTPAWMEACLKEEHIVSPTGTMCIRSLPTKQSNTKAGAGTTCLESPKEQFGVAKYAAAFQDLELSPTNHVLKGFSVLLCGGFSKSGMTKDLTVLLKQAGASIISSSSIASRMLTEMLDGKAELNPIVFLCDDSPVDESCGISDALFKQAKKLLTGKSSASVHCVAFSWLFDSIGCASTLQAAAYEPAAPRARELWKIATTNRDNITSTK